MVGTSSVMCPLYSYHATLALALITIATITEASTGNIMSDTMMKTTKTNVFSMGVTAALAPSKLDTVTLIKNILLRAKRASNLQGASIFLGFIKKKVPLGCRLRRGNFIKGDLISQLLQSVMFLFGRHLWRSPNGQWLQNISNIKHIQRWGADSPIASRHFGNQHPYSYAYETTRSEA